MPGKQKAIQIFLFSDALSSNDVNDGSSLSSFTTTASATVSGGSSVFNMEINPDQRTVDELERGNWFNCNDNWHGKDYGDMKRS